MARTFNLGNTLVVAGLLGLTATFFLPSWSADRVARVEGRAEAVARALLATALASEPLSLQWTVAIGQLRDRLLERYAELGLPQSDAPELVERTPPSATFRTRHYLFRVVRRPLEPGVDPLTAEPRSLAVYAWPRTTLPPGRTVFYIPSDGPPAYSRNLSAGYAGLDREPSAAAAIPRDPPQKVADSAAYRSTDNERWIKLP